MAANWMSGYVADVAYTLGFYREIAPLYLNFACIMNGVDAPRLTQSMRYCELGCGRGYGTALLAAANPDVEFVGIDFNPAHVAEARSLAVRAKIPNITFFEMAFGDAARSSDPKLSDFDVVAIHGVYTWIEPAVRNDIHQFIREKLLAGGIVYNSYNTLPGWASAIATQHLLMEVANRSSRDSVAAVREGIELLTILVEKGSGFGQNPGVKARVQKMAKQNQAYLAHEFLNTGWQPLFVTEVMANFAEAKLTYVGSATLVENRLDLCVPKDLQDVVRNAPDVRMRELLKDYVVNKQFRRDIYVKGPQLLSQREQRRRLAELLFAPSLQGKKPPEKFSLPIGEFTPKREAIAGLVAAMEKKPASGGELLRAGGKLGLREAETILLLLLLVHTGSVAPVRPDHAGADRAASHRLNDTLFELAAAADSHRFLAAPLFGSAIPASFIDRIVAPLAIKSPAASDAAIARKAFERLEKAGRSFRRAGKPLAKSDENVQDIAKVVHEFRELRLPRWRAMGVVRS